MAVLNSAAYSR